MSTRDQIVETTSQLLEQQGYHATGLNQIVQESGAPKGSLYYYFPEGKEELTAEAIERSGRTFAGIIETEMARYDHPAEALHRFLLAMADHVEAADCRAGAPTATVALELAGRSERLTAVCRGAYERYQAAFAGRFVAGGIGVERAGQLALLVVAAIEGGIILSRTQQSADPLRQLAVDLRQLVAAASG